MTKDTCPGCDGTLERAIQQGREITTYEPCASCREREDLAFRRLGKYVIVPPTVRR